MLVFTYGGNFCLKNLLSAEQNLLDIEDDLYYFTRDDSSCLFFLFTSFGNFNQFLLLGFNLWHFNLATGVFSQNSPYGEYKIEKHLQNRAT